MPDISPTARKFFELYDAVLADDEFLAQLRAGGIVSQAFQEAPSRPAVVIEVIRQDVFDRRLEVESRMAIETTSFSGLSEEEWKERGIVYVPGVREPCWNCGADTPYFDTDFDARLCSVACQDRKAREYNSAVQRGELG